MSGGLLLVIMRGGRGDVDALERNPVVDDELERVGECAMALLSKLTDYPRVFWIQRGRDLHCILGFLIHVHLDFCISQNLL